MKVAELFERITQTPTTFKTYNLANKGLSTLEDLNLPKIVKALDCSYNKLTSLDGVPLAVAESFSCSKNLLTSLEGCPIKIGEHFFCAANKLTSLSGIARHFNHGFIEGNLVITANPITSHIVEVLAIPQLKKLICQNGSHDLMQAVVIVNKHLQKSKNINLCKRELIDSGLAAFAKI